MPKLMNSFLYHFYLLTIILLRDLFFLKLPGNPNIHLKTYCCCTFNQKLVPKKTKAYEMVKSPIIFGLAVMIENGHYFPAVFERSAKGPDFPLTATRNFVGPQSIMSLYE